MKRPKSVEIDWYDRLSFEKWAAKNGLDMTYEEDWTPWWECWKAAYSAAMNKN